MSCSHILYANCNNVVEWQTMTNAVSGAAVTTATVAVTVLDGDGVEITGETWPKSMPHVATGTYRATLSEDINITPGQRYSLVITATVSGDVNERVVVAVAEKRRTT